MCVYENTREYVYSWIHENRATRDSRQIKVAASVLADQGRRVCTILARVLCVQGPESSKQATAVPAARQGTAACAAAYTAVSACRLHRRICAPPAPPYLRAAYKVASLHSRGP